MTHLQASTNYTCKSIPFLVNKVVSANTANERDKKFRELHSLGEWANNSHWTTSSLYIPVSFWHCKVFVEIHNGALRDMSTYTKISMSQSLIGIETWLKS